MTDERLPWFKCEPTKLLGALSAMKPDVGYLYSIILLRIYEASAPCPDTLDALARRTGFNKRRVSDALDVLFRAEKLYRTPTGIMNPKAAELLEGRQRTRAELSQAGKEGAARRWEKDKTNQTNGNGHAMATPTNQNADLELDLESELRTPPNGGVVPEPKSRAKPRAKLPPDWQLSVRGAEFAATHGFHGQQARTLAERFKNHHWGKGTLMADCEAYWRTWVLNEVKFNANRGGGRFAPARGPSLVDIALGRNPDGQ